MIEESLHAYLVSQAAITAIAGTRIYPTRAPQGAAFPRATYQLVSREHRHATALASGTASSRYQISCWGASYATAKQLADAIRETIDGYSGAWGSDTIDVVMVTNDVEFFEPPSDGAEVGTYHVALDVLIGHRE